MEGRYPNGIIVVRHIGPGAPLWTDLFGHSAEGRLLRRALSRPFTGTSLYERTEGTGDGTERLVICETDAADLTHVMKDAPGMFDGSGRDSTGETDIAAYRRVGPEFRTGSEQVVTGILTVGTRCTDLSREDEFNRWYNEMHVLDQLGSGCYHTAYRYAAVDRPGEYFAIYETDADDPDEPSERILNYFRPKWAAEGRWTDLIEVTSRAAYRKVT